MPWTPPKSWTIGQLVTAADMNGQVRDNLVHLKLAVGDDGKIPAISAQYFASVSGTNITGVAKLASSNSFTAGVQNLNAGAGTRFVAPAGVDKWAT